MSTSLTNTFAAFAAVILAFATLNTIVTVPPAQAQAPIIAAQMTELA